ncbi:phospholipase [Maritimibacter sp. 55A14]|uniref:alpha/beta hydrolase n=1 Tax=Maritimibacter sp. 55A14 TaxID=2174844 RepID=UPI000D620EFF|nr:prolyl oligopeptidase family serine peptidase [Maritimibacter sp. 55A14]PWE33133.1 phospholipase [Maritimibacter sp. 55A14]
MRKLHSDRRPAASGNARSLVIFLHGYGADGADLLGLADPLAPHMPDTVFVAPNAPERSAANPMGYQWFPIPWLDGSSEQAAQEGMERAIEDLNGFLDATLEDEGISAENTIIFGFSQGTMMALHVVPRRPPAVAGIVGFSGRLLAPERLEAEVVSKPPVLLVHGDQDEMVPPQSLNEAGRALDAAGFNVFAHVMRGTGHGIAPDGLSVALQFMREQLYD